MALNSVNNYFHSCISYSLFDSLNPMFNVCLEEDSRGTEVDAVHVFFVLLLRYTSRDLASACSEYHHVFRCIFLSVLFFNM